MYVAERQNSVMGMVMTKKYFSTSEGEDYDEVKFINGLELIESKKEEFSLETYEKILELFNKYKKFIG